MLIFSRIIRTESILHPPFFSLILGIDHPQKPLYLCIVKQN